MHYQALKVDRRLLIVQFLLIMQCVNMNKFNSKSKLSFLNFYSDMSQILC